MNLDELAVKKSAYIKVVNGTGALRHHLLDMGLTPKTEVTLQKVAPMGDPIEIELRGYELTLRLDEAKKIEIENIHDKNTSQSAEKREQHHDIEHPGIGELGKAVSYRENRKGDVIPKGEKLKFALAGNQNSGKTTLFNQLTGSNQHVGNFPGVTVDKKTGIIRNHPEAEVTDLPGIYSLSPYSNEEIVTRDFLIDSDINGIINIVDATNIERNLYLTMQLMELQIPMVLALNMMDEVRNNGGSIRINELEEILGIPVIPISAAKNEGIEELAEHAVHVARHREAPGRIDFCADNPDENDPVSSVHRCIHATAHMIEPEAVEAGIPVRFAATKLVEKDHLIEARLKLPEEKKHAFSHLIDIMEEETRLDREAALANMRFTFIENLCKATVVKPHESKEHARSMKIDKMLTGKYTAIPCFIIIIGFVFAMTFSWLGAYLSDLLSQGITYLTNLTETAMTGANVNPVITSLVVNGVFSGVGSVLSFLPTIVTLFFFLSILEDTGYMARVAFIMDKPLRKIGLSGRSFVPMLIGFGCSVPAIMATRTLSSERDRKMTIILTPFMSCSAKLPIYSLIISVFFPAKFRWLILILIYAFGILTGILYSMILKKTRFKGEPVPFVMELPNYRLPSAKSVLRLIWEKSKDFLQKAFTIIFAASIIIWFLQTFDYKFNIASSADESLLSAIGNFISPIFKPLGFDDWRISTAIITGFTAKESVVSTLTVLLNGNAAAVKNLMTPFISVVFLVFVLLYTPCVAAIATVRREGGHKMAALTVVTQCVIAWIMAFIVKLIGSLIGFV